LEKRGRGNIGKFGVANVLTLAIAGQAVSARLTREDRDDDEDPDRAPVSGDDL
jgi:hypothetical protein